MPFQRGCRSWWLIQLLYLLQSTEQGARQLLLSSWAPWGVRGEGFYRLKLELRRCMFNSYPSSCLVGGARDLPLVVMPCSLGSFMMGMWASGGLEGLHASGSYLLPQTWNFPAWTCNCPKQIPLDNPGQQSSCLLEQKMTPWVQWVELCRASCITPSSQWISSDRQRTGKDTLG